MDQGLTPSIAWGFAEAIRPDPATAVSQDAIATVSRRDADGTVWVAFDGATSDTPVSTVLSAVSVGERVRVSIHGGRVTIVGNSTSPGVGLGAVDDAIMPTRRVADASISLAREAKLAANSAVSDAGIAKSAAEAATRDAATAKEAAESAVQDARVAHVAADEAKTDAISARISATDAKASAERANTAANDALTQLSVVEDVAGTLSWISEHGTFTPTEDTEVVEGTVYFSHDGTDYVPVVPTGDEDPSAEGWYVLDVTESQADYVMSHLAVTASGLWVLPGGIGSAATPDLANGYKMLLANDGAYVYDGTGHLVTKMGESIELDSERPQHIGGEDAYILYYDSDDDGMPDSIVIGGERVSIGGRTLTDMFDDISQANAGVESAVEDIQSLFEALDGKADGTSLADLATSLSDYKTNNDAAWAEAHDSFVTNATLNGYVKTENYKTEIARLDNEIDLGVKKSEVWTDGEGEEAGEWAWDTAIRLTENRIQTNVSETYATKADTEQTGLLTGAVVTAADALAATPRSLTVYGSSTQDGTPTPEAPVAIQSVTGNLYRETLHAIGQMWTSTVSVTKVDYNRYIVNGTSTGTHWLWGGGNSSDSRLFVTLPAGTYTAVLGGADASKFSIATRGKINGSVTALSTSGNPNTFTIDSEIPVEVAIYTLANKTFSNSEVSIQLYEGSSADGTFVPYGSMGLKAVGKNLLDLTNGSGGTSGGVTVTPNGGGTFAVSGTATQVNMNVWLAGAYRASAPVLFTLPAGTYTVTDALLVSYTSLIGGVTTLVDNRSVTFTLDEETPITAIRCPNAVTGTTYDTTIYPQLELGSTTTAYQPYVGTVTPIDLQGHQLRSLPDGTRDELTVDSAGNVTLTQRVGSVTLGSSANIGASFVDSTTMKGNCTRVTFNGSNFPGLGMVALSSQNSACSHASYGQTGSAATPSPGVYSKLTTSGVYLTLSASLTSGSEALTWLGQNPVTFIYPLATPQTISLGTVDLPTLPSPEFTAWTVDVTDLRLEYWRTAGELAYEASSGIIGLSSTVTQQAGSITSLIESTEALSTMVRQYGRGVLVGRVGQGVGALVSADGSFDVVPVEWDGSTPTVGTPITTIGADVSRFGEAAGFHIAIETVDEGEPSEYRRLAFYDTSGDDGTSALVAYMTGGMLYVENSMVLSTMRIGDDDPTTEGEDGWEWIYQPDKNLTLKWRG